MKLAFFAVPALVPGEAASELNAFLSAHRVLAVDRELVREPSGAWWAICVSFLGPALEGPPTRRGKLDYKELLSEADFALYARLRMLRKEIAEREAVPPYALFTNEQLAAMVTGRVRTEGELGDLPGVGPARVEKYGAAFLEKLREADRPLAGGADG